MVGTGMLMLAVSWTAAFFLWRRRTLPRPLALLLVPMTLSGWVATLAGWYTTEIGRQPWLVTGVLKTADALGPVAGGHVALTLAVYLVALCGADHRLSRRAGASGAEGGEGRRRPRRCRRARPAAVAAGCSRREMTR